MDKRSMKKSNLKVFSVEKSKELPSLILLHGYGANGRDLVGLAHYGVLANLECNWYFLEAPLSPPELAMFGGRAWFNIRASDFGLSMNQKNLERFCAMNTDSDYLASLEKIKSTIWNLNLRGPKIIGGFSQGAMMATNVFMQNQDGYEALVALSGAPFSCENWPQAQSLKHVFVSHGQQDAILPFFAGEALAQKLSEKKFEVEKQWFQGGHEIPPQILKKLASFISKQVSAI